jgi:energy-coupling factor transport system substrate-specific component
MTGLRSEPAVGKAGGPAAGVSYLRGAQNDDGGFSVAPDSPSSLGMTGWASLGLEAGGVNPRDVRSGGNSAIDYLRAQGSLSETGDLERTILALAAAGVNPRSFDGQDLVAKLRAGRGKDGSWSGQVNLTAFGVLALAAAGERSGNGRSAAWLAGARASDGGWGFTPDTATGDTDSTGATLQALAAAGGNGSAIASGIRWLRREQQPGGGFRVLGGGVNAQSTAWAVQGLVAAGANPTRVRSGGRSGLDYLASLQAPDGHYRYSASSDQTPVWVTGQALLAITQRPFPLSAVARAGGATKGTESTGGSGSSPAAGKPKPAGGATGGFGAAPAPTAAGGADAPAVKPATTVPVDPAGSSDSGESGGGGGSSALAIGLAALAVLAAGGAGFLIRRGRAER